MSEVRWRPTSLPGQLRAPGEQPAGQGAAALERLAAVRLALIHPAEEAQAGLRRSLREVQYALVRGLRASGVAEVEVDTSAVCTVCFSLPDGVAWAVQPAWVDIRIGAAGSKLAVEAGAAGLCAPAVTLALLDGGALLLRSKAAEHHELRMWRLGAGTHVGLSASELHALSVLPDGSTRRADEVCADAP